MTSLKPALVTGGSRGIGRAVALRLASDGRPILVGYAGGRDAAESVVAEIVAAGGKAAAVQADISDPVQVNRLFGESESRFGELGIVVHSAGIMALSPIAPAHLDEFDKIVATNLRGAFLVLGETAARLGTGGRIIALSSSVIARPAPGYGAYIASKAGVEGLVHVLAQELRGRGVTVNAVAPGPTGTELFLDGKSEEEIDRLVKAPPLERLGEPEDIARAVAFLAGPDGAWVHGQILRVNGGFA